ncbi:uncharacterized protein LOC9655332 isoform X1 [Selaginella moellendorffii]|uniref:uncharacterized protein LOC9655332 isoform X1 n=1 Tax=Selaginella moellendorffii TaxID=88036 RepID=UPI000D1C2D84|nr:uncharacterized protein LOC9655332 isoform X1 [Selaginella moellendorffii]|eukprot:XP_024524149.1 uncharacterized protein LOC9655332 isoform X1 [Selaginella moellendorffii]
MESLCPRMHRRGERKKEHKEKKSQEPRKLQFIGARKPAAPVPMKTKTQQGCRGWPEPGDRLPVKRPDDRPTSRFSHLFSSSKHLFFLPDHVSRRYPAIKTGIYTPTWKFSRLVRRIWSISRQTRRRDSKVSSTDAGAKAKNLFVVTCV